MPSNVTQEINLFLGNLKPPQSPVQSMRLTRDMFPKNIVLQSFFETNLWGIKSDVAANRPSDGSQYQAFFATDTNVLSLWNGSAWKSTTLS